MDREFPRVCHSLVRKSIVDTYLAPRAAEFDERTTVGVIENPPSASLGIFERRGWFERREVAYTLANIAACLHMQGRRQEAVEAGRAAVAMQRRTLGMWHPDVKLSEANLAIAEGAKGVQRAPSLGRS